MTPRRFATVLAAGLLPLTLTACASSKSPHTYDQRPTVDAAQASMGDLELRNVSVSAPPAGDDELAVGEDATVTLYVVNQGEAPDRLVAASSPAATSVEIVDGDGLRVDRVDVPPLGAVGDDDFSVRLRGLTQAFRPGQHIEVTFTFTRAGRQTLTVPVEVYTTPVPRPTHDVFEHHEGGEGDDHEAETEGGAEGGGADGLTEG